MSSNNRKDVSIVPWYHWPHMIVATGLGTGFWPWVPGTLAGFVALIFWLWMHSFLSPLSLAYSSIALIVLTLIVGIYTDKIMEKYWGEDPRTVVIDEFFGTWIAVLAVLFCPNEPSYNSITLAFIAFTLFRIIDITKPLGCRWVDNNIHGGLGCMLDDALAGFYAIIITLLIRFTGIIEIIHDLVFV